MWVCVCVCLCVRACARSCMAVRACTRAYAGRGWKPCSEGRLRPPYSWAQEPAYWQGGLHHAHAGSWQPQPGQDSRPRQHTPASTAVADFWVSGSGIGVFWFFPFLFQ